MKLFLGLSVFLSVFVVKLSAYAHIFERTCRVNLHPNSKVMGYQMAVDNSRTIQVFRGQTKIENGSSYVPGESLTVTLNPTDQQSAFQIISGDATFVNGFCEQKRIVNYGTTIMYMPLSGNVEIIAGSASQFGKVSLTQTFSLTQPVQPANPGIRTLKHIPTPQVALTRNAKISSYHETSGHEQNHLFDANLDSAMASKRVLNVDSSTGGIDSQLTTFTVLQRVIDFSSDNMNNPTIKATFVAAMEKSLESFVTAPESVSLVNFTDTSDIVRNKDRRVTRVTYHITYDLNKTQFTTTHVLFYRLNLLLYRALDSAEFLRHLLSLDDQPVIGNINKTILESMVQKPQHVNIETLGETMITNVPISTPAVPPSISLSGSPANATANNTDVIKIAIQQQAINLHYTALDSEEAKQAFLGAMERALESFPQHEHLLLQNYTAVSDRVTNKDRDVTLITYELWFILNNTPYNTEHDLLYQLNLHLYSELDSNRFESYLQEYNVPALSTVFQTVLGRITAQGALLVESPLPSEEEARASLDVVLLVQSKKDEPNPDSEQQAAITEGEQGVAVVAEPDNVYEDEGSADFYAANPPVNNTPQGGDEYDSDTVTDSFVTTGGAIGSSTNIDTVTSTSVAGRIIIGVVVGIGSMAVLSLAMWQYLKNYRHIQQTNYTIFIALSAVVLVIAAVVQMSFWAQDDEYDRNSLGVPNWTDNLFAFHPVFMVCGFITAQIIAINDWNILSSHRLAKLVHILLQTAGLAALVLGLYAVFKAGETYRNPRLNTIHSWMGVAAVAMFCLNYTLGWFMGIITVCYPNSVLRRAFDMKRIHRAIGLASLGLSVVAVLTGIMDKLPRGSCYYPLDGIDTDPTQHYGDLLPSCKLAYGVGMTVVCAALCTVLAVSLRADGATMAAAMGGHHNKATGGLRARSMSNAVAGGGGRGGFLGQALGGSGGSSDNGDDGMRGINSVRVDGMRGSEGHGGMHNDGEWKSDVEEPTWANVVEA